MESLRAIVHVVLLGAFAVYGCGTPQTPLDDPVVLSEKPASDDARGAEAPSAPSSIEQAGQQEAVVVEERHSGGPFSTMTPLPDYLESPSHPGPYTKIWHKGALWMMRSFDRRNGTDFARTLVPQIVPAHEVLAIMRREHNGVIFGSPELDAYTQEIAETEGAIGLVYLFPNDPRYPTMYIEIPFPEDRFYHDPEYEHPAVGVAMDIGLARGGGDTMGEGAGESNKAARNEIVEIDSLAEIVEDEAVVLVTTAGCGRTNQMLPHIKAPGIDVSLKVYVLDLSRVPWIYPTFIPVEAGPVLTLIAPERQAVLDAQFLSAGATSVRNFFARRADKKEQRATFFKDHEDREKVWRTLSSTPSIESYDLSGMELGWTKFDNAIISGADFSGVDASKASFINTIIYSSDFSGALLPPGAFDSSTWIDSLCPDGTRSDPATRTCSAAE